MRRTRGEKPGGGRTSLLFLGAEAILLALGYDYLRDNPDIIGLSPYNLDALNVVAIVMATAMAVRALREVYGRLRRLRLFIRAVAGDASKGTARWLSVAEAKAAGLHRRARDARFCGVMGRIPLWLWTETHHLIIGPAGSSKTTAAILNIVASIRCSCLINDMKGEIRAMMAPLQCARGYQVVALDPTDPTSASVNPLDIVRLLLHANDPGALSMVGEMAFQLYPEPKQEGNNRYFRDGSRRTIGTVVLCVAATAEDGRATLGEVYLAMTQKSRLNDLLIAAAKLDLLGGELAARAEDLHAMAFGDEDTQFEQFRIGAINALEPFGPGNHLNRITRSTTFSFAEMKRRRIACYLIVSFENVKVFGPWSGLMQWLAARELVAVRNSVPVVFVLDEFCNTPLHILPEVLTLLRSYGVRCVMATQDLTDIIRVYSKNAFDTIMAETDIKQFLSGVRSPFTLDFISKYLGKNTAPTPSFSLGDEEGPKESLSSGDRALLNPDEIRRLSLRTQIIIHANLKPILAHKVQIFAIAPWRRRIGVSTFHGGKRYLKPVEVRVFWWWSWVTRRGRQKLYATVAWRRVVAYVLAGFIPPAAVPVMAAFALAIWSYGAPHVLWEYRYSGARGHPISHAWCRYIGPEPLVVHGSECPLIVFRRSW